jgi:hypothetical protein
MSKDFAAILALALLLASPLPSFAGPCSPEIDAMQARIDAKIEAEAAAGQAGAESAAAMEHRQPTPKSIAEAEVRLGDITARYATKVGQAMARARSADLAGEAAECEEALAVVRKSLGD